MEAPTGRNSRKREGAVKNAGNCMNRKVLIPAISILLLLLAGGISGLLLYMGVIHINNPSRTEYPVRGVDLSHYQGEVDWEQLSKEDICFAYIKATEGSRYRDRTSVV